MYFAVIVQYIADFTLRMINLNIHKSVCGRSLGYYDLYMLIMENAFLTKNPKDDENP